MQEDQPRNRLHPLRQKARVGEASSAVQEAAGEEEEVNKTEQKEAMMSFRLELLPMTEGPEALTETLYYSRNRLAVGQNYNVYGQINLTVRKILGKYDPLPIQPRILPAQLWISDGPGKKKTRTDAYGCDLTFLYAYELRGLQVDFENRAVKAYIDVLPDDTPIILFWR